MEIFIKWMVVELVRLDIHSYDLCKVIATTTLLRVFLNDQLASQ